MKTNKIAAIAVAGILALGLSGCVSDADRADQNVVTAAENFEVQRTIVGQSGIDGSIFLFAEGRCSFEYPAAHRVDVICKYGPDEYRKHVVIFGDQDRVVITQEQSIDVSEYHTRVVIKPQNLLPEFDIKVGED